MQTESFLSGEDDVPDDRDDQDWVFNNHPDLVDPRWAKQAKKAARRDARRARRRKTNNDRVDRPRSQAGPKVRARSIVLVVVVVAGAILLARHPWSTTNTTKYASDLSTTTHPAPLDLRHPFANTPAATWADGVNGIQLPVAQPVGNFSASQVAADLNTVKQVLVAAHLDPKMLVNHDPATYLSLLAPSTQSDVRHDFTTNDVGTSVTLLATGYPPLPVPVKVDGTMSVSLDQHGNVAVHTNYVFAYPFAPSAPGMITQPWEIDAVVHSAVEYDVVTDNRYPADQHGVYVAGGQGYFDSMGCAQSKQGYLAPAYSDPGNSAPETESPYAYYNPNHDFNVGQC